MGYHDKLKNYSFSNKNLQFVLKKRKNFSWTLGFDTPSLVGSSSGNYFSRKSVGHLGFTGTSFWIDLQKRLSIVILSNRVFFGNENDKIKIARPVIHDIIMEEMFDNE
jgi:CubicO group peptidase (beta-lactamase class C family)